MKFKEYQEHTKRTLPNLSDKYGITAQPRILDLVHMRLGIVSELEELISALKLEDKVNLGEELADTLWYMSNDLNISYEIGLIDKVAYDHFAKWEFGELQATDGTFKISNEPAWLLPIVYNSSALIDQIKKQFAYGKPFEISAYIKAMGYLLGAINNIAKHFEVNLEEQMDKNIAKLMKRYPDKFSEVDAINRDTEAERRILET